MVNIFKSYSDCKWKIKKNVNSENTTQDEVGEHTSIHTVDSDAINDEVQEHMSIYTVDSDATNASGKYIKNQNCK